jgi:hypothetical protein
LLRSRSGWVPGSRTAPATSWLRASVAPAALSTSAIRPVTASVAPAASWAPRAISSRRPIRATVGF